MIHRRLLDARAEVEGELCLVLAQEDQEQRETDAKEATAFAETLPHVFAECDRRVAEFRRCFAAAIDAVNRARGRGWNVPSQEMLQSKLARALKTALSLGELRMLDLTPLPPPERCTFTSIGEAYACGILGGAKHSVLPPPPPQPPKPAAKSDKGKLPPRGDVGMRFKDDPKGFEIRVPIAR